MLRLALLPSQKDTGDEGTMDVAAETGCLGVWPEAVAEKQAGLLLFRKKDRRRIKCCHWI